MCGLNGIFAYHGAALCVNEDELVATRDHMASRGPDGSGQWISEDRRIGLGHRRLAIIDPTDAGAQPMTSADGSLAVVFNGEIYNHRTLRQQLQAAGHRFRTSSDTEVILHLYADRGPEMVTALRGMYAIAVWDVRRRRLLLTRDPYGIKPLYLADDGWTLRFASQVKALIAGGGVSREREPAGWAGFYLFGSVPEPFTTYQAVRALPAGTTLLVDTGGGRHVITHHRIADVYRRAEQRRHDRMTDDVRAERLREVVADSVRHHLVADVPVGAFLSGGIDSGALVGVMRDCGASDMRTITIAFDELRGSDADEAPLAARIAERYGTAHTTRMVGEAEFGGDFASILAAMDQPSIDGINTWFAAKAAREQGLKVVVSGLGGDELLGGYPSFRDVPRLVRWMRWPGALPGFGRAVRHVAGAIGPARFGMSPKAVGLVELGGNFPGAYLLRRGVFLPWELPAVMSPELAREGLRRLAPLGLMAGMLEHGPRSAAARVATLEATLYMRNQLLRDADWAGMAHSVEIRVPLADVRVLEAAAALRLAEPGVAGKQMLAHAPRQPLPGEVASRPKTGFVTPIAQWQRNVGAWNAYRRVPQLAAEECPWARRWAYGLAAA